MLFASFTIQMSFSPVFGSTRMYMSSDGRPVSSLKNRSSKEAFCFPVVIVSCFHRSHLGFYQGSNDQSTFQDQDQAVIIQKFQRFSYWSWLCLKIVFWNRNPINFDRDHFLFKIWFKKKNDDEIVFWSPKPKSFEPVPITAHKRATLCRSQISPLLESSPSCLSCRSHRTRQWYMNQPRRSLMQCSIISPWAALIRPLQADKILWNKKFKKTFGIVIK